MMALAPLSGAQKALVELFPLAPARNACPLLPTMSRRLHTSNIGRCLDQCRRPQFRRSVACQPSRWQPSTGCLDPSNPTAMASHMAQSVLFRPGQRPRSGPYCLLGRRFTTSAVVRERQKHSLPDHSSNASSQLSSTPATASSTPKPLDALRAATKHENIYTLPNFLTFTRLLAAPGLAYLIVQDQHLWTLGLFAYAGITDLLDGWIARRWNQKTVVGTVVDPMADKTLMMAVTLALAAQSRLPMPLAVVILGRDALLGLAALYYRYISLPPPKTMARYWDFSLPSAEVHPTGISKVNTALQLALIGATVAMPVIPANLVEAWSLGTGLLGFQWVVGCTTVWSGLSYVWSKDAVKILGSNNESVPTTKPAEKSTGGGDKQGTRASKED